MSPTTHLQADAATIIRKLQERIADLTLNNIILEARLEQMEKNNGITIKED